MTGKRKPIEQGDPVAPIPRTESTGLHEADWLMAFCIASPSLHARRTNDTYVENIPEWIERNAEAARALLQYMHTGKITR